VLTGESGIIERLRSLSSEQERCEALSDSTKKLFPSLTVDETFPPAVFVHGTLDSVVNVEESRSFAERLNKLGVEAKSIEIEAGGSAPLMRILRLL
jgi:dipeptidyl aminopeptidase/acylaminoacyl peptidase